MDLLKDLLTFFSVPIVLFLIIMITLRGHTPKRYKIVRITNTLDEVKYEVWFEYFTMPLVNQSWKHEETFDTETLANQFIARQFQIREVVREGKF